MIRKSLLIFLAATSLSLSSRAASDDNSGSKKETLKVTITDSQIDVVSGVVYSQITSPGANRPLKMTLLTPRTKELKPAIIYFPGGGFTSADHGDLYWFQKPVIDKVVRWFEENLKK